MMRSRIPSFLAAAGLAALVACDGTGSTPVSLDDVPSAGSPSSPVVKIKGDTSYASSTAGSGSNGGTPTDPSTPTTSSIVGTWKTTGVTLILKSNGTATFAAGGETPLSGTWSGSGSSYSITFEGSSAPATLSGNTLTVATSGTTPMVLTRS